MGVRLLVGTAKGGFWVTSSDRREWAVEGPFFKGWKVTAGLRLADGGFMAGVASDIYGPGIFLSGDGEEWEQVAEGPAYPDGAVTARESWEKNETGLASGFGFPIVLDDASRFLFAAPLEPVTGGVRELTACGGSLREVLDDLVAREPRLKPHLFNEAGEFRRHVLCFHNGTNTRWMNGWDAPMSDGDTILFMQAVSGG